MFEATSVNQTLWNVLIQAFVNNGSKSDRSKYSCSVTSHSSCNIPVIYHFLFSLPSPYAVTSCAADLPTTTATPTTHASNTTTAAPITNATSTAPPTTTPTPTLPTPTVRNYTIKPSENDTACLLAKFGLRIGVKQGDVRS